MHTPEEVLKLFRHHLPVRTGRCELSLARRQEAPVWVDDEGYLFAAMMIAIFDEDDENCLLDVKEQHVCLGEYAEYSPERWLSYFAGYWRSFETIVKESLPTVEMALPADFFGYAHALDDETLQTADNFYAVFSDPIRLRAWNAANEREEWREMLEPCGLADHIDEVRALGRPALRMVLEKVEADDDVFDDDDNDDDVDEHEEDGEGDFEDEDNDDVVHGLTGASRVGGDPDVPADFEWPMVADEPLMFVAQINLAEVVEFGTLSELPREGLLSFFYGLTSSEGAVSHPVRVFHFDNLEEVARRQTPEGVERISEYRVSFAKEYLFPAMESYFFYESLLPEEGVRSYHASLRDGNPGKEPVSTMALSNFLMQMNDVHDSDRPTHRLLGHPDSIQGDPYLDVEVNTSAQGWKDWRDGTPEAYRIQRNSLRWRLLLQIDAQEEDELLLNQDGGFFYFFIPADALAKHDWTRVRGELQCH